MKLTNIIKAVALTLFISGCATGYVSKEIVYEGPFKVTNVVDGDTLDLNNSQRIRLSGINTPETGECYYQEAKNKLEELILNKDVYTERDITNKDKYGRFLRYIYYPKGTLVNKILVKEGYADAYDKYASDTKRFAELNASEQTAKANKLGIWSCTDTKIDCLYIYSKNSKTYHKPDCKWVKRISQENQVCIKTEEELKELNLKPCGTCNP